MEILEVVQVTPLLLEQLIVIWEKSVKATHLFLSEDEVEEIKKYVPQALMGIAHLIIARDQDGRPAAFMGIEEQKLEMLFIAPEKRGKGLGRELLQYGIENYSVSELAVNEQNPLAKGFYEHMGFQVYKRTDYDEQGSPYPLLYMKLK
ncbi:GNAT family N-acetyltransferase [bacterium D16-51]|nr:GNAT family N-acetyltransferase [bacterium D16-59]RKI57002.1 GNAT family N-acetyltransferase [bacterium D16-51]